ncbi:hypothetical protein JOL62DRAFT_176730 [Phyllosticta paracitricarpa]|uniref:Uncharacterized protein n=2 Tax=Phyllosticta TaxID=121621 RepID=A0ABR1MNV0_9PEZI
MAVWLNLHAPALQASLLLLGGERSKVQLRIAFCLQYLVKCAVCEYFFAKTQIYVHACIPPYIYTHHVDLSLFSSLRSSSSRLHFVFISSSLHLHVLSSYSSSRLIFTFIFKNRFAKTQQEDTALLIVVCMHARCANTSARRQSSGDDGDCRRLPPAHV